MDYDTAQEMFTEMFGKDGAENIMKEAMKMQAEVEKAEELIRDRNSPFFPKGHHIPEMAQVEQNAELRGEKYIIHTTITHPDGRRERVTHEVDSEIVESVLGETVRQQQRKLVGSLVREAGKAMLRGIGSIIVRGTKQMAYNSLNGLRNRILGNHKK